MSVFSFHVPGEPAKKGSWRPIRAGKHIFMKNMDAKAAPWTALAKLIIERDLPGNWHMNGAYEVAVRVQYTRPKSHRKASGQLKDSAPIHCTNRKDLDKNLRLIGDSMTGIVFDDDGQISQWTASKVYADTAGVYVTVTALDGPVKPVAEYNSPYDHL